MQQPKAFAVPNGRRRLLLLLLLLLVAVLAWRAYDLQVLRSDFLSLQGDARRQRVVTIPAYRGVIYDRNNQPLAISTPVDSVWVNPKEFLQAPESIPRLAKQLVLDPNALQQKVSASEQREFMYVRRQLPPPQAAKIAALNLPGVFLQREYRRYYPTAEVSAHVLGFTNIDDHGQEGIELAYDDWLRGQPGAKRVLRDRLGRVVADIEGIRAAYPGRDVHLSIDKRLQYLAYRELKAAVEQHRAASGSAVILDSYSGEVLAMANQPAFNPHNRRNLHGQYYRNRAVTDVFEPGSTMKPFTVAAALENQHVQIASEVETRPGYIQVSGHTIRDPRNYGLLAIRDILRYSSNVGASKLALAMPSAELWQSYHRFGFGRSTGSGFPGESEGHLNPFEQWSEIEQATLAYGYSLSTTTLQLAHAYSILANGGYDYPVSFLRQDTPQGARVLSQTTAVQLREMLVNVVSEGGTGSRAQIPGYRVAGKTGTVRKPIQGGYSATDYVAVFAGMAPLNNPRLVMVVVINQPQNGEYYGGKVAAPVFAAVMGDALRLLNIPPDDIRPPGYVNT